MTTGGRNHRGDSHFSSMAAARRSATAWPEGSRRQPRSVFSRRRARLHRTYGILTATQMTRIQIIQSSMFSPKSRMNTPGIAGSIRARQTHFSSRLYRAVRASTAGSPWAS